MVLSNKTLRFIVAITIALLPLFSEIWCKGTSFLKIRKNKKHFFEENLVLLPYSCLLFSIRMVINVSIVKNNRKTIRKLVFSNPV